MLFTVLAFNVNFFSWCGIKEQHTSKIDLPMTKHKQQVIKLKAGGTLSKVANGVKVHRVFGLSRVAR